jgi:hypothetical protein
MPHTRQREHQGRSYPRTINWKKCLGVNSDRGREVRIGCRGHTRVSQG